MQKNHSPWIHQLQRSRSVVRVTGNTETDIVIVGGGISGVSTAFFLLAHTDKRVTLIEATHIAHGATGHNAGQMVSYFEKQLAGLVETFGVEMAIQAQRDIESAWDLLDEMYMTLQLETPMYQFSGLAGISNDDEIRVHLKNAELYRTYGLNTERLLIAENAPIRAELSSVHDGLYTVLPLADIQALLESKSDSYIAALVGRKGCMNSALFTEEVVTALLSRYADRFVVYEESPVSNIVLDEASANVHVREHVVTASHVVLCTNGFEKFSIVNNVGNDIDTLFHDNVSGTIGYMSAYIDERDRSPIAISYINTSDSEDAYFYLTRRPYEKDNQRNNLICVGGPEVNIEDTNVYSKTEHQYPEEAATDIDTFLHSTYAHAPDDAITYTYQWHGLMGYTQNRVRLIGREPRNPVLMYNLGCNGIGILPSVFGARKIARIVAGESLPPSIFDPR